MPTMSSGTTKRGTKELPNPLVIRDIGWMKSKVTASLNRYSELEYLIGSHITFLNDLIEQDGIIVSEDPCYSIQILSMDRREWYYYDIINPLAEEEIFHLMDSYFLTFETYCSNYNEPEMDKSSFSPDWEFSVKDKDTLILKDPVLGFVKLNELSISMMKKQMRYFGIL